MNHPKHPPCPGVYQITCVADGRRYIGSSVCIRSRISHHFNELRRGIHSNRRLQEAYNRHKRKYFRVSILEKTSECLEAEQRWIDQGKPEFNICRKVEQPESYWLGKKRPEEHLAAAREALRGSTPWNKGKKTPKATRLKQSRVAKGRIPWNKGIRWSWKDRRTNAFAS